jgi:drug/metabolite transporter (DMT)-like permease
MLGRAFALASNVCAGIGVVLANKWVFTSAKFKFPVALTVLHYAVNYTLLLILACSGAVKLRGSIMASDGTLLHATTAVWALHNALSNLSLQRNSVGVYQISKIMVTPLICAIEFAVYHKAPPARQVLALSGACAGVALATINDVDFEMRGAATAMASAAASAVLKVLQQEVLQRRGWSSLELMSRTWGPQLLLLLVSVPFLEQEFEDLMSYEVLKGRRIVLLLISALAGFALNVSSLVVIKLTSAIAIVLLNQSKTVLTLIGGFLFFDRDPQPRMLAGATLAICSIAIYTYNSIQDDRTAPDSFTSQDLAERRGIVKSVIALDDDDDELCSGRAIANDASARQT